MTLMGGGVETNADGGSDLNRLEAIWRHAHVSSALCHWFMALVAQMEANVSVELIAT
jgi:hypothetical protein